MTQGNILELAKQGNPDAIAALMSRSMKSQGIDVRASLAGSCLEVLLEAEKIPSPPATVAFIRKGMMNLGVSSIEKIRVSAQQVGDPMPIWQEEIMLKEAPDSEPSHPQTPAPRSDWDSEDISVEVEMEDDLLDEDLLPITDNFDGLPEENLQERDDGSELPEEMSGFASISEFPDDEYPHEDEEDMEDSADATASDETSPSKSSPVALLLLLLVALGLGGFFLYTQKPQWLASLPFFQTAPSGTSSSDDPTATDPGPPPTETSSAEAELPPEAGTPGAESPTPETSTEPFRDAVNKATSASNLAQTAQTPQEWQQVVADWEGAIALMEVVPQSHPKYQMAQDRIPIYQRYLQYARGLSEE